MYKIDVMKKNIFIFIIFITIQSYSQDLDYKAYLDVSDKNEYSIKILTHRVVKEFLLNAGLTEKKSANRDNKRKKSERKSKISAIAEESLKKCFHPNTKIVNIASENLETVHFLDYIMFVKTYLPVHGVKTNSDFNKLYKAIFTNPHFLEKCNLIQDGNKFQLVFNTEINVFNAFSESDYKEVTNNVGKLINLKIYIAIDLKEHISEIYKIEKY
jgi:hypothetical protein